MTRELFEKMDLPKTLTDVGIGEENLKIMADKLDGTLEDTFIPLSGQDVYEIYKNSL